MACRGLHIALDDADVAALRALEEDERVEFIGEELEGTLWVADRARGQETDKAWDAIHRSLTDGGLAWDGGPYPLGHVILGGELLYEGDDYILSLKSPQQVRDVAAALPQVTRDRLRAGYDRIDPADYGFPLADEDFDYTWDWFQGLAEFYQRAADAGRAVIFTADQ
jgi:hypothetical protein